MKAMILAAGLGTRLRPLTDNKPKALIAVNGMPLLEIVIRRLKLFGCEEIIINIHHFGDQIIRFLNEKKYFDIKISISDERDQLLETGGGLKKAAWFFKDGTPFILCNTDILSDIDLARMYKEHLASKALVTVAVRKRESSRYFIFDESKLLHGWIHVKKGVIRMSRATTGNLKMLAFSGIHIINPETFEYMKDRKGTFSIVDTYLKVSEKQEIRGFLHDEGIWMDVGKKESLEKAKKIINQITLAI